MKNLATLLSAAALLAAVGLATSCRDEPTLGERIEGAADDAAAELEEAGEEVRDEIDDHTDER